MPSLLDQKIEAVLETVQKPSRYIGGEANQVSKPTATRLVALMLEHRQTGQGLGTGEVQVPGGKAVLVVQTDLGQRHGALLVCCYRSQGGRVRRHPPFSRQGIAPRTRALEDGAPARTDDPAYPGYYDAAYKKSKGPQVRFWPDITAKDAVVGTGMVALLVMLAVFSPAPLEAPADPTDTSYVPRPEWYFLPFYQLLKLVPGSLESAVAIGIPAAMVSRKRRSSWTSRQMGRFS